MKQFLPAIVIVCGLTLVPQRADSETKAEAKKAAAEQQERSQRRLTKILQGERMGVIPDRQKALKALINSGNAPDEAYWQAGFIKKGDEWISVEQRYLTNEEETKLDAYAKVRNPTWNTPEANYELAKWCDQHGLQAQARAHLMSILLDHPDNAELRQMLGYQRIANRWMNEEEFNAAVAAAEGLSQSLKTWSPVVSEIRAGLESNDTRKQNEARIQLEQIDDIGAIPVLEMILLAGNEQSAAACVNQLSRMKHRDSTLALCRAAMFLPESAQRVIDLAIEEIKSRPLEHYVTTLLSETSTPMSLRVRMIGNTSAGQLDQFMIQLVGSNESYLTTDQFVHTHVASIQRRQIQIRSGDTSPEGGRVVAAKNQLFNPGDLEDREQIQRFSIDALRVGTNNLEEVQNQQLRATQKICDLLTEVTGESSYQDANDWWNWWNRQQETAQPSKFSRIREVGEFEVIEIDIESIANGSCFVARTPVWTERGPRPIEKLHIGDLVLTKDIESGELAYKPVIRTTVREPKPLVTIDFGPEQITATGGHPFWVSGTGWVKARDLKQGQWVHTPTGAVEVEGVTEAEEREVYNLVVDGFHTYFVGHSQLLCHDVSITSPTDAVVPGLIDR